MPASARADLLILGSGPAGYSAAVYAARANLQPLLITGTTEGAASTTTAADFVAWPMDIDIVQGPTLKRRLRDHAERTSTRVVFDQIRKVDLAKRPFELKGDRGTYICSALIVAIDCAPETRLFNGQLAMKNGRIVTQTGLSGSATLTSVQGVFVAGEVQDAGVAQVITNTGTGCMAALDAQRFLGR